MGDHQVTSWAIDYLNKPHDKPFFLACGLYRPHMPWQVPAKYYDLYPLDRIQLPKTVDNDLADIPSAGIKMAKPDGDHATILKTENWRYAVQAYLASIAFADAQVGRLLDALDASPHGGHTIVVLWGDHGWHLGEKEHWRKFALWEEATRAPLMIAAPSVTQPGVVCQRSVDFMNVYPTLAELCGLPIGDHLDGVSMAPLLRDPHSEWNHAALTTHGRLNHAVRDDRWRYIRYADGSEELYDHETDPAEANNLAADPNHAETKSRLAAHLPEKNAPDAPHATNQPTRRRANAGKRPNK
ncbi:MAG: sulfatase [Pirellulaceae bacterium]